MKHEMTRFMKVIRARALAVPAVAAAAALAAGCWDSPAGPSASPLPFMEYITVDPSYQQTGRIIIGWSHPQGPQAVQGQPAEIRITNNDVAGVPRTEVLTTPFDTRRPDDDIVEVEYRGGRNARELRITQFDVNNRSVTLDCFGPGWNCFYRVE